MGLVLLNLFLTSVSLESKILVFAAFAIRFVTKNCSISVYLITICSLLVLHCNSPCFSLSSFFFLLTFLLLLYEGLNFVKTSIFLFFLIISIKLKSFLLQTFQVTSNVGFSKFFLHLEEILFTLFLMIIDLTISGAHAQVVFCIFSHFCFVTVLQIMRIELSASIFLFCVHYYWRWYKVIYVFFPL